jgi:two-component system, OmpR family, phosphate regulon response regulator OmpR
MRNRVLIIDDDEKLRKLLKEYLEGNGFETILLADGSTVMTTLEKELPDIVILDIMLPGKDGLEVLKEIKMAHSIPIIMLTAKGDDTDRIVGLELGADDYMPKPFNPRELLARIRAVLRRAVPEDSHKAGTKGDILLKAGGLTLNRAKQTVLVEDKEMELSSTEYKILEILMQHPNTVFTRDQLMNLARGRDFVAFDRSIDVHVSKLRAKLESDPRSPVRIKTVWGAGYMFVDL